MSKETITPQERLQLMGLLMLADKARLKEKELQLAIAELLGVAEDADEFVDVIGDLIWSGSQDADVMLDALKIAVAERKPEGAER